MSSTVKDIARLAQVSAATVSLVLNGKGEISGETRARVLSTAASLNYRPRRRKPAPRVGTSTLRFLKLARHGHTVNRDHASFISDYIDGMSREAGALGYSLEVVSHQVVGPPDLDHPAPGHPVLGHPALDHQARGHRALGRRARAGAGAGREGLAALATLAGSLADGSLGGAIVLGTELARGDVEHLVAATAVPLVFIDTWFDGIDCSFVDMNNHDAVCAILDHFLDRGIRRIGCITTEVETVNFQLRRLAFERGLRERGLAARSGDIVVVDSTFDGACHDMRGWLASQPDLPEAFFCSNDIMALGCIKALREVDIRIPETLSIVGFDNLPMSAAMVPALTTVDVSKRRIGAMAVRLLDERIRVDPSQPAMKVLVGTDLVIRDSVRTLGTPGRWSPA